MALVANESAPRYRFRNIGTLFTYLDALLDGACLAPSRRTGSPRTPRSRHERGSTMVDILLRGITWEHRRAIHPLVNTIAAFRKRHPEIGVAWDSRPLHGFEIGRAHV